MEPVTCQRTGSTGALHGRTVVFGAAPTPDALHQLAEEQGTYVLEYHSNPNTPAWCEWCGEATTIYYHVEPNQPGEPAVQYCAAELENVYNTQGTIHLAPCVELHCPVRWHEHAMGSAGCVWANQQY